MRGVRSIPVIPQRHVEDPGHSAKSAGGRSHLNTCVLFVLYTQPPSRILFNHSCPHQFFADDTQLRKSCGPEHYDDTRNALQTCISDIKDWMTENNFQLNADKTNNPFQFLKTQASTCTSFDLPSHHFLLRLSQEPWFLPRQGSLHERTHQFPKLLSWKSNVSVLFATISLIVPPKLLLFLSYSHALTIATPSWLVSLSPWSANFSESKTVLPVL